MNKHQPKNSDLADIPQDVRFELSQIAREAAGRRTGFEDRASIAEIERLVFVAYTDAIGLWQTNPEERPASIKAWIYDTALSIAEHFIVPQLEKVACATASTIMRGRSEQEIGEIVRQSVEIYFSNIRNWDQNPSKLPRKISCWIGQVAKNRARKWMTRESLFTPLLSEETTMPLNSTTPDVVLDQRETCQALLQIIDIINNEVVGTMPQEDRDLWYQFHFDFKSAERFAEEFEIEPDSVRRRWFRLTLKVHHALEAKIKKNPVLHELFIEMLRDPKCFLGLANLSRMLRSEGAGAVKDLAESFCVNG